MRRRRAIVPAFLLGIALFAGCAPTPAELSPDAAVELQAAVVSVAESAAAGDDATALVRLDELQQRLDVAVAADEVSADRAAAIRAAIDVVRADLQPAPAPVEPTEVVDDDSGDEAPDEEKPDPGDDSGKGSDKGKGKDKDDEND